VLGEVVAIHLAACISIRKGLHCSGLADRTSADYSCLANAEHASAESSGNPGVGLTTRKQGKIMQVFYRAISAVCAFAFVLPAFAAPTDQWYLRGPEGGFASGVAIDQVSQLPLTGGIAGMYRYSTLSSAWNYANTGAPTPLLGGIATTPTATFINSGGYVARSTDGGVTWVNVSDITMGDMVSSVATSAASSTRVYATVDPEDPTNSDLRGGLWISDNLGGTWTQSALTSGGNLRLVRASPTNADLIFIAGGPDVNGVARMFRSADAGVTFGAGPVIQSGGTVSLPLVFVDVAQNPFDATTLVALSAPDFGSSTLDSGGEVWVSHDAGVTWGSASTNNFVISPETTGGGEPRAVLFDKLTQDVVYFATTWGVFKGGTAAPVPTSAGMVQMGPRNSGVKPYDEVDGLTQAADGTLYAATTSGGVYKSVDGATNWIALRAGYDGLKIRTFAFQPGNTRVVLAGSADPSNLGAIYRSTDGGATWAWSSTGMNAGALRGLAFSPSNPSVVIAAGFKQGNVGGEQTRGLWRSSDAGQNWARIDDAGLNFTNKRSVVFDPNDGNKIVAADIIRVNVSVNAGVNWTNSTGSPGSFGGLPFANNPALGLIELAAGPKSGGGTRFYASIFDGQDAGSPLPGACQSNSSLPCTGGVYYSDDGYHWTAGSGITDASASWVAVGATPGTVFAGQGNSGGYPGGVYKSTDYGATWADSSTGLTCHNISALATDPSDPLAVWAGCPYDDTAQPGGVYRSSDGGSHWVSYSSGLRNPVITRLALDPANAGHVLAGGAEGIHELRLGDAIFANGFEP
jgi:photosystem II stability/assembly factor-like uncharacterized protein